MTESHDAFRFVVVGAPSYLDRHGTPEKPQDLLRHECITFRAQTTGALYAWELERGRKAWRVPVRGGVVTNDSQVMLSLVESGAGLTYAFEPNVQEYAPTVPLNKLRARTDGTPWDRVVAERLRRL